MWEARQQKLGDNRGLRFTLTFESGPATFAQVLRGWQTDAAFRSLFNGWLADVPFAAFRWETPGLTLATQTQPFEFVVLDSPGLARRPDPDAFAEHFVQATTNVVSLANLGGDAVMIVPCPISEPAVYGHLAAFVRLAPERQRDAFWQSVGEALQRRINDRPVWLNTAGAGVSWLHVRLDDRPKYYGFGPYKGKPA